MAPPNKPQKWMDVKVMTILSLIAIMSGAFASYDNLSSAYDRAHTSEDELAALQTQIDINKDSGKCRHLDIRIVLTENTIWQLESTGGDGERLVEKRRELRQLISQYQNLQCSIILGQSGVHNVEGIFAHRD